MAISIHSLTYVPEIRPGDRGAALGDALRAKSPEGPRASDVLVATQKMRTLGRRKGLSLSAITDFARAWRVGVDMVPATNDPLSAELDTSEGRLPFQRYFAQRRCKPVVQAIHFRDAAGASPEPGAVEAILDEGADCILIAPSSPYPGIDPILAASGFRGAGPNEGACDRDLARRQGGQGAHGHDLDGTGHPHRSSIDRRRLLRPFNLGGHPPPTIPVMAPCGLPIGIQIVGRIGGAAALCALGRMIAGRIDTIASNRHQELQP